MPALVSLAHGLMPLAPPPDMAVLMDALLPRCMQGRIWLGVAPLLELP